MSDLHDDLQRPEYAGELLAAKDAIENITEAAPVEPLPDFPEWTQQYRDCIAANLPEVAASC